MRKSHNNNAAHYTRGISGVAVLVIVVVIAAAGAGIGYSAYKGGSSKGEAALTSMVEAMQQVKSAAYQGTVDLEGTDADGGSYAGTVTIDGKVAADGDAPRSETNLSVEFSSSGGGNDMNGTVGASVIQMPDMSYVKLNELSLSGGNGQGAAMITGMAQAVQQQLGDRWVSFENKQALEQGVGSGKQQADEADMERAKAMMRIARDEFMSRKPYQLSRQGAEKVSGAEATRYSVTVDISELMATAEAIAKRLNEEGYIADKEYERFSSQLSDNEDKIAKLEDPNVQLWIDSDSNRLRKVALGEYSHSRDGGSMTVSGELTVSDYGSSVTIEKPAQTVSAEKLMQQFFGGMMGGAGGGMPSGAAPAGAMPSGGSMPRSAQ